MNNYILYVLKILNTSPFPEIGFKLYMHVVYKQNNPSNSEPQIPVFFAIGERPLKLLHKDDLLTMTTIKICVIVYCLN